LLQELTEDARQELVKVESPASALGSTAACSITDFTLSINADRSTLAIAGGVGMVIFGSLSC
jgi:hypothetical protein